jgi:hypothetical protein
MTETLIPSFHLFIDKKTETKNPSLNELKLLIFLRFKATK